VTAWFIEAQCFTVEEQSVYVGDINGVRAHLDQLSRDGWQIAAAYEIDVPAVTGAPRAVAAGDTH
jgi:hypothetical protein